MLSKETILDILKQQKGEFADQLGWVQIGLFGSYAKDTAKPGSDIDLLIDMPANYTNLCVLWNALEKKFNTKVDLVRRGGHLRQSFLDSIEKEIMYS